MSSLAQEKRTNRMYLLKGTQTIETDKYCCHHQILNELLEVMSNRTVRDVATSIQANKVFTIMADEVTGASNRNKL